jgi:hypothetical protein
MNNLNVLGLTRITTKASARTIQFDANGVKLSQRRFGCPKNSAHSHVAQGDNSN